MTPILECNNLTKVYTGSNVKALDDVSVVLGRGRIIGLLGPNGSGKTTLIKLINGLLSPTKGSILVNGLPVGVESKSIISYLPEVTYLNKYMKVKDIILYFKDFYSDFNTAKAEDMMMRLRINPNTSLNAMSKGTKEKVQLILVMSREAQLYILDEPIGGVDPAARDFILNTIISNYNSTSTILLSTHLISDVEKILDEVIFLKNGRIDMVNSVDNIRSAQGKSVDQLFREVFRC